MPDVKFSAVVTDIETNGSKFYYGTAQDMRFLSADVVAVVESELNYLAAVCQRLGGRGKGDLQATLTYEKDGASTPTTFTNISNEDVRKVENEFSRSMTAILDFMADRRRAGKH